METINVPQGSLEWLSIREKYNCSSDSSAVMGDSSHTSRNDLMTRLQIGDFKEHNLFKLKKFTEGHDAENAMRPIIERMFDIELYPVVGIYGDLLASFDGLTMDESTIYEHKLWNEELAQMIREKNLSPHYYWQLEQQLYVSKAECVLFVCSDGTPEKMVYMIYQPAPGRIERLLKGWVLLREDLKKHIPTKEEQKLIGKEMETLPTVFVQVEGKVTTSNLGEFSKKAKTWIASINKDLQDDQDFADAEKSIKALEALEKNLETAETYILGQMSDIDAAINAINDIKALAKSVRLPLTKDIKNKKDEIKQQILTAAVNELNEFWREKKAQCGASFSAPGNTELSLATKGLKTLNSFKDATSETVAKLKLAMEAKVKLIAVNMQIIQGVEEQYKQLFVDTDRLIVMDAKDLSDLVEVRISKQELLIEQEAVKRAEQERERIRAEEERKIRVERELEEKKKKEEEIALQKIQAAEGFSKKEAEIIPSKTHEEMCNRQDLVEWIVAKLNSISNSNLKKLINYIKIDLQGD